MKRDHDAIKLELERLTRSGVIRPVDVVEAAKNKKSPLHACFTWDDGEAAQQFRLLEARNLLRVYVTVEGVQAENVRAFVSLSTDRIKEGGGYRAIADVIGDDELRTQYLQDAFVQLRNLQQRYRSIQQLAGVWREVDKVEVQAKSTVSRGQKTRKHEKAKAA